ncbi:acylphosphatase [Pelotomaculum terephthalicicum JT]|uniref:acylphosphatase n=1 Tax=Pelotomaculum terephthalicicum TaxID=206393 RepID=UPI0009CA6984|nr:acylphosphatase [Pelotomaculum terephthalicicum]MCG9968650.1 acylphosphatase [Pelotomaculum terephthalicicum JT]OPY60411.1 MAG: Acylphosphatase [Pelotomaculum sp. PtaU1.Bin065]
MSKQIFTVRAHVIISGKVQGVYYRAKAREQALTLKLSGWIKNMPDGRVEGIFEGGREGVDKMIDWCRQGPARAVVTGLEIKWEEPLGDFSGFMISPTRA